MAIFDYDTMAALAVEETNQSEGILAFSVTVQAGEDPEKIACEVKVGDGESLQVTLKIAEEPDVTETFARSESQEGTHSDAEARLAGGRLALSEAMGFVEGIRAAQIAETAIAGQPMAIDPWPRPIDAVNADLVEWTEGSGFDKLGWQPGETVRASYSVEVTEDGFTVHAWLDGDGDGERAHVTATKADGAVRQTDENIY